MTELEQLVASCKWRWTGSGYTTVKDGYGFVIYRNQHQMWFAGLAKETVLEQREYHKDEPPHITGFWDSHGTKRMFEIPASAELLSAVILSACPELSR